MNILYYIKKIFNIKITFLFLTFVLFITSAFALDISPQKYQEAMKSLTPSQQQAVQDELLKGDKNLNINSDSQSDNQGDAKEQIETEQKREQTEIEETVQEKKSDVSTQGRENFLFQRYITSTESDIDLSGKDLNPYGYNFFSRAVSKSIPSNLPVPEEYIIGPGDNILIFLWGRMSGRYELLVDRDGLIDFPTIGPLSIAGMPLKEMRVFLKNQAKTIVGTNISISMGRLRTIQIYVTGEVKAPGLYLVSALSTVTDALMEAQGPSNIGSLRNIQVNRGKKNIVSVDFYKLIQNGDQTDNIKLQNGDVIFIPTVGALVGVTGHVKRPAVYELKDEINLSSVLKLAGGVIPSAYKQQVQIERFNNHQYMIVLDITLKAAFDEHFHVKDGDLVKIFPIVEKDKNVVFINGNIKRPGKYQWKDGMRINEIIKRDHILEDTYLDYALIKRINLEDFSRFLISFNLDNAFNKETEDNLLLQPEDQIYVFSKWMFTPKAQISIKGEVRDPGTYEITENSKIKDVILLAHGLTRDASFHSAELLRKTSEKDYKLIKFSPSAILQGDEENNIAVQDGDQIIIHSIEQEKPVYNVDITGEVKSPGKYLLTQGATVIDLLFRAGGLNNSAYLEEAELTRSDIVDGISYQVSRQIISLDKALQGDKEHNIFLKPYDRLIVKPIPEWKEYGTVKITGEVIFPGEYTIEKGEKLSSLLTRAGGYTDKAFLKGALLSRKDIRISQKSHLDKIFKTLQSELEKDALTDMTTLSSEDAESMRQSIEYRQNILNKLKDVEVPGRLSICFKQINNLKDTVDDIILKNQDNITIPQNPESVQVLGMVYNATAFLYRPGLNIEDYLTMAGGPTDHGDKGHIYLSKADGQTLSLKRNKFSMVSSNRYLSDNEKIIVEEGDVIIVPETTELPGHGWKKTKDFVQFIYTTAASMASLKYIFE